MKKLFCGTIGCEACCGSTAELVANPSERSGACRRSPGAALSPTQYNLIRGAERDAEQLLKRQGQWRGSLDGHCVVLAVFVALWIRAAGAAAKVRAGTCLWPLLPGGMDPGAGKETHFGYVWSPGDQRSKQALAVGRLPEIHAWVETPTGEIVDLTTAFLPAQAARSGLRFSAKAAPPDHFWSNSVPLGVNYQAVPDALDCVLNIVRRMFIDEEIVDELSGNKISKRIKKILRNARRAAGETTGNSEPTPIRREELEGIVYCPPVLMFLGRLLKRGRPCAILVTAPEDRTALVPGPEAMTVTMLDIFVVIDSRRGIADLVAKSGAVSSVNEIAGAPDSVIPIACAQSGRVELAHAQLSLVRGLLGLPS